MSENDFDPFSAPGKEKPTNLFYSELDLAFNNVKPKDWYFVLDRLDSGQDLDV